AVPRYKNDEANPVRHADADGARHAAVGVGEMALRGERDRLHAFRRRQQFFAVRGQLVATGLLVEQPRAKRVLESCEAAADGGMLDLEPACGLGEFSAA